MRLVRFYGFAAAGLLLVAVEAGAQVCVGNTARGGVSYVNGKTAGSKSNGGALSYAPGRFAIGISGRAIDSSPDEDGFGGALRLSLVFGRKLRICPTAGIGVDRLVWNATSNAKVTSSELIARGGLGAGYDIMPVKNFGIAPFIIGEWVERGTYFKTELENNEPSNNGDYTGKPEATYGVLAHFSRVFVGASASHRLEKGRPDERLLFGGITF